MHKLALVMSASFFTFYFCISCFLIFFALCPSSIFNDKVTLFLNCFQNLPTLPLAHHLSEHACYVPNISKKKHCYITTHVRTRVHSLKLSLLGTISSTRLTNPNNSSHLPTMFISLCTVIAPFGVKPPSLCLGWQARSSLRAKRAAVADGKNGLGKTMKEEMDLDVLYDDGFGSVTMNEYLTTVRAMLKNDGGPPRWFCPVECGRPKVESAPLLLFLPGMFFFPSK